MSIRDAFIHVVLALAAQRLGRAKASTEPSLYEFYITDVVELNMLARAMSESEDPIDPIAAVHDGLRTLVVEELILAGLVTDEGDG